MALVSSMSLKEITHVINNILMTQVRCIECKYINEAYNESLLHMHSQEKGH